MPTLKHDIIGRFPPRTRFGTAGDKVEIISLHGHVFIVQGPDGMGYHTIADDMDGIPPEMEKEARAAEAEIRKPPAPSPRAAPPEEVAPVEDPEEQSKAAPARKRAPKSAPKQTDNQGSLF